MTEMRRTERFGRRTSRDGSDQNVEGIQEILKREEKYPPQEKEDHRAVLFNFWGMVL